jgi:predicted acylesterase/phospholipase RssA
MTRTIRHAGGAVHDVNLERRSHLPPRPAPDEARGSPPSPNLTVVLGVVVNVAYVTIFASVGSLTGMVVAAGVYVALLVILVRRVRLGSEFFAVGVVAGALPGFGMLGFGGLVALEVARLAGSDAPVSGWFVVFGILVATVSGIYLAAGLTAIAAGGVRRAWLPVVATLVVPIVAVAGSSLFRDSWAEGATPFHYALIAALFAGFAAAAWPRVRAGYATALEEIRRQEDRKREKNEPQHARTTNNREQTALEAALEKQIADQLKGVGLALSGGGHRAALFALGVLLYLVRAGKHRDVAQISSVSGGSLTNGYVGRSLDFRNTTVDEFDRLAGKFARQLADRGTLFAYWQSVAYLFGLVLTCVVSAVGFAFWIRHPRWLPETWLVPAVAVSALVLLGYLLLRRGALCRWAFRKSLFSNGTRPLRLSDLRPFPLHVFCATELQTGLGAYFFNVPFVVTRDADSSIESVPMIFSGGFQRTVMDFDLATAVQASAALPGAFPPVELPVRGWYGITRRTVSRTWERFPAQTMLLVDGGVRDNLGVEWFLRSTATAPTLLVVVNGAANKVPGRPARIRAPWFADLMWLLRVADLPYNSREQNRRQELLTRFIPSYRGQSDDIAGVILHIEESPYDLAEAITRGSTQEELDSWMSTPADIRVFEALQHRADFEAIRARATALCAHVEQAEDVNALRDARVRAASDEIGRQLASRMPASVLVSEQWARRAHQNSTIPTTLSMMGRQTAAELMRHSFALAMAKLHLLVDYPLCDVPSIDELDRLMAAG